MDRVRCLGLPDNSPLDHLIKQHPKIRAALRAQDPDAAEAAMRSRLREILVTGGPTAARNPNGSRWMRSRRYRRRTEDPLLTAGPRNAGNS
ncbi:FCD domain-containing protein [Paraburkholderia youngii]|uniref:FCD domain-containing protein n=1 Tax=Paraburkholderia youngii TaxID=2782701 RepID=UPI003D2558C0